MGHRQGGRRAGKLGVMRSSSPNRRGGAALPPCLFCLLAATLVLSGAAARRGQAPARESRADGARPRLVAQVGHSDNIKSIVLSPAPGSPLFVTASLDKSALLWNLDTGKQIRGLYGHTFSLMSAAFSRDGRSVLIGDMDYKARLWNVSDGSQRQLFVGHSHWVSSVALSPDGRLALTGSYDRTARLWRVSDGQEVHRFPDHGDYVAAVAFSPDGKSLLTAGYDRKVRVYDTEARTERRVFTTDSWALRAIFSPGGDSVLTGEADGSVKLWSVEGEARPRLFAGLKSVVAITFASADEVAAGSKDGVNIWWDVNTGSVSRNFSLSRSVDALAFLPDGRSILAAGGDGTVVLWDAVRRREERWYSGHALGIRRAAFSADSRFALTGSTTDTAVLWDLGSGREAQRFKEPNGRLRCLALTKDGGLALTGGEAGTVRVWDTATGVEKHSFQASTGTINALALSPDDKYVLTGGTDNTARLWDVADGTPRQQFTGHTSVIEAVAFSAKLPQVVTGSDDMTARVWNISDGREVRRLTGHFNPVQAVAFSPDGASVLTGGQDATVRLWSVASGQETRRFAGHTAAVESAGFSPDGETVLTGSWDGTARLWEADTGAQSKELGQHSGFGISAVFSADGKYALTGSADGFTRLWSAGGDELCRLISFRDETWVITDPADRFDTNDLEGIEGLNWLFPDDPTNPLPIEIFMRQYYEPRLLPRLLDRQEFPAVPSLVDLNRVQPEVKITSVEQVKGRPEFASVRVRVSDAEGVQTRGGKRERLRSGAYGLRLFRDGQLVGYAPASASDAVPLEGGSATLTFTVRLPSRQGVKQVGFSAYAFNSDRVKSLNARETLTLSTPPPRAAGSVYLVTVGVNAYDEENWDLRFAAGDAQIIAGALSDSIPRGQYARRVAVTLLSDYRREEGGAKIRPRVITQNLATKGQIRSVFDRLAGRDISPESLKDIPRAGALGKAGPEDLVVIAFSGHGYTDREGKFYLIPSDTGTVGAAPFGPAVLSRFISSDELSEWMRDVDAGELVFIVDACHSAATVDAPGFKPGPMGSRGMGQLAYEKGMRVLAASQADDVALEVEDLRQGLLTYALIHDGMQARQADLTPADGIITLDEWLIYGAKRVPPLYEEVKAGRVQSFAGAKDPTLDVALSPGASVRKNAFQQPQLFDFKRKKSTVVLVEFAPRAGL